MTQEPFNYDECMRNIADSMEVIQKCLLQIKEYVNELRGREPYGVKPSCDPASSVHD